MASPSGSNGGSSYGSGSGSGGSKTCTTVYKGQDDTGLVVASPSNRFDCNSAGSYIWAPRGQENYNDFSLAYWNSPPIDSDDEDFYTGGDCKLRSRIQYNNYDQIAQAFGGDITVCLTLNANKGAPCMTCFCVKLERSWSVGGMPRVGSNYHVSPDYLLRLAPTLPVCDLASVARVSFGDDSVSPRPTFSGDDSFDCRSFGSYFWGRMDVKSDHLLREFLTPPRASGPTDFYVDSDCVLHTAGFVTDEKAYDEVSQAMKMSETVGVALLVNQHDPCLIGFSVDFLDRQE